MRETIGAAGWEKNEEFVFSVLHLRNVVQGGRSQGWIKSLREWREMGTKGCTWDIPGIKDQVDQSSWQRMHWRNRNGR